MKNLLSDISNCFTSLRRTYFTVLLPSSALIALLTLGYTYTHTTTAIYPLLAVQFYLFLIIPPFAVAMSPRGPKDTLKYFAKASEAAVPIALLTYLIPDKVHLTSVEMFIISCIFGGLFLIMCLVLLYNTRIACGKGRQVRPTDIKLVWKLSPGLLLRLLIGFLAPVAAVAMSHIIQIYAHTGIHDFQVAIGLIMSITLIFPACFAPFILLAEGLKRSAENQEQMTAP